MAARFEMEVLENRTLFAAGGASLPVTFSGPAKYLSGQRAYRLAVADFNGDGLPDVAVTNRNSDSISIFLNTGGGNYVLAQKYNLLQPVNVVAADFLGNGKIDLAVNCAETNNGTVTSIAGNSDTHDGLSLFIGNGDGTFNSTPINYAVRAGTHSMVSASFVHGGLPEIALTGQFGLTVIPNLGGGVFARQVIYPTGADIASFVTEGDLNGDGNTDLILAKGDTSRIRILYGNSDGTFTLDPKSLSVGGINPVSISVGNFTGNGRQDLAVAGNGYKQGIKIFANNGNGTFSKPISTPFKGFLQAMASADFNGDGAADIAAVDFTSTLQVFAGNGNGAFQRPLRQHGGTEGLDVVVADVNNDGKPDLLFTRHEFLYVLLNTSP